MTSSHLARDPVLGRTLGEYVIREKIGAGGFGAVYRAEQPALAREAVVKVLHRQLLASEAGVRRFLLEARLASRLDHPYAAHIYAFGVEADGLIWIAMELVRGTPLDRLLENDGAMPIDLFVPLCERICEVVHTAHEQGIVHRDLKPANVVVLTRAGRYLPKLLDLGIAKLVDEASAGSTPPGDGEPAPPAASLGDEAAKGDTLDAAGSVTLPAARAAVGRQQRATPTPAALASDLTNPGAIMGSPAYMAPEQWIDPAAADARSDIYALGVLTFQALTTRLPFPATTAEGMARAHLGDPVPPLGTGFPAALDPVLARAMAKRPADRFATALEFAAALRVASGLAREAGERLPGLDRDLRDALVAAAPQPVAEAVAALEAARGPHQALAIARDAVRTLIRYLALIALACRTRLGAGAGKDTQLVADLLRETRRHPLGDAQWLELARELVRPFAARGDSHPIPELVDFFFHEAAAEELDELVPTEEATDRAMSDDQALELYRARLPRLGRLLAASAFLSRYSLVVRRTHATESWMGVRRPRRALVETRGAPLPENRPVLLDEEGRPVVILWPVVQAAAPSPGASDEMFLFDGKSRRGARLVALPGDLERHDDAVWAWLGRSLFESTADRPTLDEAERQPYRGLEAFTADEADSFFGREQEVEGFVNRLRSQGLIAVVGSSGVGKSSFVQAGVVPALPDSWRALVVRPGPRPFEALAHRLALDGIALDRAVSPDQWAAQIRASALGRGETLVLVVDQFEEILTLCADAGERARASELLAELGRSAEDPVRVVLLLRDDFLVRAEALPGLRDRLSHGLKLLATPGREDLLRILTAPAHRAGYDFEDRELPAEMVDAVAEQPGALALLSFSAARLWELRDRHFKTLPRRAYQAMGGVGGALAQHAEAILAAMTGEEQRLVREAFRHLVTSEGTRAVLSREDLLDVLGRGPRAAAVIEALVASRLLVTSETDTGERVEIVHETLLGAWPRLVEWRREEAEGARLRDQVRTAARQWQERGRPKGLLWRDEALTEYQLWRARYPGALTQVEEAFAAASLAEAARGRRIRRGLVAAAFLVLAGFLVVQVRARLETQSARQLAEREKREVRSLLTESYLEQGRQLLLAGQHVDAALYLAEARRAGAAGAAVDFMIDRAVEPLGAVAATLDVTGKVWEAQFSSDGARIVTISKETAALWTGGGKRIAVLGPVGGLVAAFSPGGSIAVTGGRDGLLRVWSAADGSPIRTIDAHRDRIYGAVFSRAGDRLVTCAFDDVVNLWDTHTWRRLASYPAYRAPQSSNDCAISPDGRRVAGGGGPVAWIWSASGGTRPLELRHDGDVISTIRFDPTGERLVTGTWAGNAEVWDAASGRRLFTLSGHGGNVDRAIFSPDGRWIATAARDGTARIWDAASGRLVSTLRGHAGPIVSVAFDPTGSRVTTASEDRSAAVWDRETGARVTALHGHGGTVHRAEFDPAGRRLLTASYDGTARLWDLTDTNIQRRMPAGDGCESTGAWRASVVELVPIACRDGTRIVRVNSGELAARLPAAERALVNDRGTRALTLSGGALVLWRLPSGTELARAPYDGGDPLAAAFPPGGESAAVGTSDGIRWFGDQGLGGAIAAETGGAAALAFSPDGGRLVSAHRDGAILVIDPAKGAVIRLGRRSPADGIRVSPDGGRALVLASGGPPLLVDPRTGGLIAELRGHGERVFDAGFDASSRRLVTASGDKDARIWDAQSGRLIGIVTGAPQFLQGAAFDPSGQLVATIGGDGALRFWDASPPHRLLWSVQGHRSFGLDLRFLGADRVLTRGWDGDLLWWTFPRERFEDLASLDRFLRCRAHKRFDRAQNLVVAAPPDCAPSP